MVKHETSKSVTANEDDTAIRGAVIKARGNFISISRLFKHHKVAEITVYRRISRPFNAAKWISKLWATCMPGTPLEWSQGSVGLIILGDCYVNDTDLHIILQLTPRF